MDYLTESKKIQEAATEGPWEEEEGYFYIWKKDVELDKFERPLISLRTKDVNPRFAEYPPKERAGNTRFIAQSRTRWPRETKALEVAIDHITKFADCECGEGVDKFRCDRCLTIEEIERILKD